MGTQASEEGRVLDRFNSGVDGLWGEQEMHEARRDGDGRRALKSLIAHAQPQELNAPPPPPTSMR